MKLDEKERKINQLIAKGRELIGARVEGDGQMPRRIVVARQGLTDGGAALLARIPGVQDGVGIRRRAYNGSAGRHLRERGNCPLAFYSGKTGPV